MTTGDKVFTGFVFGILFASLFVGIKEQYREQEIMEYTKRINKATDVLAEHAKCWRDKYQAIRLGWPDEKECS